MTDYVIEQHGSRVVLPARSKPDKLMDVSVWDDSAGNLDRFARSLGQTPGTQRRIVTRAVLVHHGHNTYNRNAISVSIPAAAGGTVATRHLGYLPDTTLNRIGVTNLPDLIGYAAGEVDVTVAIAGLDHLEIDLPFPEDLAEAIAAFLQPHGITASGPPRWGGDTPPKHFTHSGKNRNTVRTLALLSTYAAPVESVTAIRISTKPARDPESRPIQVTDASTGRRLGVVVNGMLLLEDERQRDQVAPLLAAAGLTVTARITRPKHAEDGTWPTGPSCANVPNAVARVRSGALDLRARDPRNPTSQESFAIYNPSNDTLWVEDSTLVAPALRYFHRVGIDPDAVGLPRTSWALEGEISYRVLRDPKKYREDREPFEKPKLLPATRSHLPKGLLTTQTVTWISETPAGVIRPATERFLLLERHVTERTNLFPVHELTGASARCRLCAEPAAVFCTPIASSPLAYCHTCLDAAGKGIVEDLQRAALALKKISELEFDDTPPLESQLSTLHVDPGVPLDPLLIDQLVVLRFGIRRGRLPWTLLLEAAGFAEDGLRTGRGTLIRSRDGHLCQSMREKAVCDFLHQHGIAHDREPRYPYDVDYNSTGLRRADWMLTDGTLVEMWGLPKDPAYAAKMEAKRLLSVRHGIRLVELFDADLPNLPTIFAPWIPPGTRTGWTWSPLLIATAGAATKEPAEAKGDKRGRNDYNAETRRERLDRCAAAVRLQAEGFSRQQIGAELGVGQDNVKVMLRDGKFYADPASDPLRHELAEHAHLARARGDTRANFQDSFGLTSPKAQEAWRDAGVLFDADR